MLGFLETRGFAVDFGDRVDQLVRVEFVAAVVALVTARTVGAADRAGAFDVTIWQGTPAGRGDGDFLRALVDVPVLQALLEQFLHDMLVVRGGGAGKQVVAQAEIAQILGNHAVVAVREFLRADPLFIGLNENRGAVLIGSGHHQHVIALHALIARVHIRRDAEAGDMPDMARTVRVRPRNIDQNMTHTPDYQAQRGQRKPRTRARQTPRVPRTGFTRVSHTLGTPDTGLTRSSLTKYGPARRQPCQACGIRIGILRKIPPIRSAVRKLSTGQMIVVQRVITVMHISDRRRCWREIPPVSFLV